MKYAFVILISAAIIMISFSSSRADDEIEKPPNASFGAAGSVSGITAWERKKGEQHMRYNLTYGYGGGLVFEKMFNNLLGIQSGFWFNRISLDMRMKEPPDYFSVDPANLISVKIVVTGWSVSVPLSLITSFNLSFFSLNILAGIKYTHIVQSEARFNNPLMSYKKFFDMLPYINQPQFGFTLGVNFKFRVSAYVDLFIGCSSELHVTELMKGSDDIALLCTLTGVTGVMFRTNVFPMSN